MRRRTDLSVLLSKDDKSDSSKNESRCLDLDAVVDGDSSSDGTTKLSDVDKFGDADADNCSIDIIGGPVGEIRDPRLNRSSASAGMDWPSS